MDKTFLGLTTASELTKAQEDRNQWKASFYENNEIIERFQIENTALKQDLADCKAWAKHLEDTNKALSERIAKVLAESEQTAMLHNQATVEITGLKLANQRYKIAADNFIIELTK